MTTKQTYSEDCVCKCALMCVCTRKFVCENNESPRPRLQLLVSERKKNLTQEPQGFGLELWIKVCMATGCHSQTSTTVNKMPLPVTYRNRWRTRLAASPVVFAAFLSGRNPDKQMHPLRRWDERGRAGWLKFRSPGGALGQAGPHDPLPAEPVLSRELIWCTKQKTVRKEG